MDTCSNYIDLFILFFLFIGREVDWVQCDGGCNEWFHMLCVGLVKSQIKADDDFICKKCKKVTSTTATPKSADSPTNNVANNKKNFIKSNLAENTTATNTVNKKRLARFEEDYPDDGKNIDKESADDRLKTVNNTNETNSTASFPSTAPKNTNSPASTNNQQSQSASGTISIPAKKKK